MDCWAAAGESHAVPAASLACLAWAAVLAPASADAAGVPNKAARLIGTAAAQARKVGHPAMDLPPDLRRQVWSSASSRTGRCGYCPAMPSLRFDWEASPAFTWPGERRSPASVVA